jgi:hypothetical protein
MNQTLDQDIIDQNITRMLIEDCAEDFRTLYWGFISRGLSHEQIMQGVSQFNRG